MQEFGREERVGAALQRELSRLIRDEVRDPRIGRVTIQDVRVSRDLSHAKVYFSLLDENQAKAAGASLARAAAFLRRRLGALVKLRTVPELHFEYDNSLAEGNRLSALIDRAVAADHHEDSD